MTLHVWKPAQTQHHQHHNRNQDHSPTNSQNTNRDRPNRPHRPSSSLSAHIPAMQRCSIRWGSGPLKSTGSLFDHSVGRPILGLLNFGMSHSLRGSFPSTLALLLLSSCQCTGSEFTQHNLTELDPYDPPCPSQSLRPTTRPVVCQPQSLFYSESGCVDLLKIRDFTHSVYI